ncbi:FAD-binding oxidoreductase [Pseudonocardia spinosispora]|uniref:FAD-binding oxidoreductase n=1 Tax=Pseudonocardia spinosispora TaxID=103441 RepID=UPI00040E05E0|nr:FAD-binding protein [Pseudonocardia spinosispora]
MSAPETDAHHTTTVRRPTDVTEASAVLADSTGPVQIRGAGTAGDWAGQATPAEQVLDTTSLTGVLAHNPSDMTVSVRAGTPLRELNTLLAEHGQRVALDAARVADGASVGGLIATADAGPSALTYGSLRDLVIGATLVLADGTVAHSGGHVIKNVAGYDLTKLVHGSHGALALVAEAVLRLHPLPEATATVRLACSLTEAAQRTATLLASPLEPVAVEWFGDELFVRVEGTSAALDRRVGRLVELLDGAVRSPEADADDAWDEHARLVGQPPTGAAILRIGARPSRLAPLLVELVDTLAARAPVAGLATGIATVAVPVDAVPDAHRLVHRVGGTSTLRRRPSGSTVPGWGVEPSAIGVLRAVKTELDPDGRLGAGRFAPWM